MVLETVEVGSRFGKLTVVERLPNKHEQRYWLCLCDCGGSTKTYSICLRKGRTRSCGCLRQGGTLRHGHARGRKGGSLTYKSWRSMLSRCYRDSSSGFHNYGGRGITVCERWRVFEHFLSDMGERPSLNLSLDRIDNNGNYEPGNCKWSTRSEQATGRRIHGRNVKAVSKGDILK